MISDTVLETDRLILRDWREEDLVGLDQIFSNEEHARYIGGVQERWQTWRMLASMIGHKVLRGFTLFAVEEKQSGAFVGWSGPWFPEGWPEHEIGYSLVPSATGKGFAKEAVVASIQFAYETLGWTTAVSNINADNLASQKVAASVGAIADGTEHEFCGFNVQLWRHLPPEQFKERFA